MRERKYRAYHPESKKMVYFDLAKAANDIHTAKHLIELLRDNHENGKGLLTEFTGLKDVNGVDIYEGDILHQLDPVIYNPFTVEYSDQFACFISGGTISKIAIKERELVVIGNIHENPELIKE